MNNVLVIGAVGSTALTIELLLKHSFNIKGIVGHEPVNVTNVSGWSNLKQIAIDNQIDYIGYQNINTKEVLDFARDRSPEIIFAVGFSQLLGKEWFSIPKYGIIGFHPTPLPQGRGRAPIAWSVLELNDGAATFFLMDEGADSGAILEQEPYAIDNDDDSESFAVKCHNAMEKALNKLLPKLKRNEWYPLPQDEKEASWYGARRPEDGIIHWTDSAYSIDRLIKAAGRPYQGAYTYIGTDKLSIFESEIEENIPIKGVVGRILLTDPKRGFLVQCGNGLIWIRDIDYKGDKQLKVGMKLDVRLEDEIISLKKEIEELWKLSGLKKQS